MDRTGSGVEGAGTSSAVTGEDAEEAHLLDGPYGPYDPRPGAYGPRDPGGGPYDPETGLRDWYGNTTTTEEEPEDKHLVKVEWSWLLDQWALIECDLHETFGVDVESGILRERTWRWLNLRINDLIKQPSRLRTAVATHYGPEV